TTPIIRSGSLTDKPISSLPNDWEDSSSPVVVLKANSTPGFEPTNATEPSELKATLLLDENLIGSGGVNSVLTLRFPAAAATIVTPPGASECRPGARVTATRSPPSVHFATVTLVGAGSTWMLLTNCPVAASIARTCCVFDDATYTIWPSPLK